MIDKNHLPDLYNLWDYNNPAKTAEVFHNILPTAKASRNLGYHIELLTQMARTHSLQSNFEDAHALLDEAQAMLTTDLAIPQIRLWLERGRTFNSSGKADVAIPLFEQAYNLGAKTRETADFHTVDAAHMLGIALPNKSDQLNWNLKALQLAADSPDPRTQKWKGSLLNNIGWAYHDQGDYQQALTIFEEAYAWHKGNAEFRPTRINTAKWCIGRTYRSLERYSDALDLQKKLVVEIEQSNQPPDGFVSEEIGECLLALGQETHAKPYFSQAYVLLSEMEWIDKARLNRLKELSQ